VARLIDLANLAPVDSELCPIQKINDELSDQMEAQGVVVNTLNKAEGVYYYTNEYARGLEEGMTAYFAKLPKPFRDYLGQPKFEGGGIEACDRYEEVRAAREVLTGIARQARRKRLGSSEPELTDIESLTEFLGLSIEAFLDIGSDGLIQLRDNDIADCLIGIEADRIRTCETCSNFFWAGRSSQKCCSKPCANRLRVKRWREKYPTTYKLARAGFVPPGNKRVVGGKRKANKAEKD